MKLLIVEDSKAVRQFLRLIVAALKDIEVDEASDGVDALKMLAQRRYDLILLDLNLPHIDGMKLLATLRQDQDAGQTHVILVTTRTDPETIRRARDLGVYRVLPKPIEGAQLLDAIRKELGLQTTLLPKSDRRQSRRLRIPVSVEIEGEDAFRGTTSDLSPFGAFVQCERNQPLGARVRLLLLFEHVSELVAVWGRVVHVQEGADSSLPRGFGIRFEHDDPEAYKRLLRAFSSPDEA